MPDTDPSSTNPLGSVEGSAAYSPVTLIMRYLQSQNPPVAMNAANIRAALEANARNPGTIPGLRNMEVEDSNPRVPSTRVGGAAPAREQAGPPPPPAGSGTPTTSAAPTDGNTAVVGEGGGPSTFDIAKAIALGAAGLGAGAYGYSRMGPQPGASVPSEVFRPPAVATQQAAGGAPTVTPTPGAGEAPLVAPEAQTTPLDTAINRAVEPYGPPDSYARGVNPVDQDLIGNYRPGPSTPTENRPLPFNSAQPRVAPTAAEQAAMARANQLKIPKFGGRVITPRLRVP